MNTAFAAYRDSDTEEAQDNLADATDRLEADITAVVDEVLLLTLKDLRSIVAENAADDFAASSQQPMSDDWPKFASQ